jgi:hypothetical protein
MGRTGICRLFDLDQMARLPAPATCANASVVASEAKQMGRTCRNWPMFDRVLSHAQLMDEMLERVGAEPGEAVRIGQGTAWHEARTQCLGCADARRCRDWLHTADALAPPPDFCRSATLFRQRMRGGDVNNCSRP